MIRPSDILLNPDRLDMPLKPMYAGKLSSAVWRLHGAPLDIDGVNIQIERGKDGSGQTLDPFTAACTRQSDGSWKCYLNPYCFQDASATSLKYHVIALDSATNPRWLGSGSLRVLANPANGSPLTPDIIPADTYIRNPVTGRYHKLVAEVDDLGNISIAVDQEGIER